MGKWVSLERNFFVLIAKLIKRAPFLQLIENKYLKCKWIRSYFESDLWQIACFRSNVGNFLTDCPGDLEEDL